MVLSTMLYGAESWTCTDSDYERINAIHNKMIRNIAGVKIDDISNNKLYHKVGIGPIYNIIKKHRLRWAGHVSRMTNPRIPKKVLHGELVGAKRGSGRPRKSWTDCLKDDLSLVLEPRMINWFCPKWKNSISSLTSLDKKK